MYCKDLAANITCRDLAGVVNTTLVGTEVADLARHKIQDKFILNMRSNLRSLLNIGSSLRSLLNIGSSLRSSMSLQVLRNLLI